MIGSRFFICLTVILLAVPFFGEGCWAEFSLHPGIYTRLEMTDNLFLTESDRNRELIATVAPNLWLEQQSKLFNLELEYSYEMYRYLEDKSLNDQGDTHLGRLDGLLLPERDFRVELHGDASLEVIDQRRSDVVDTPSNNTTNRYLGRIRPTYHLDLGSRHSAEAAYAYETVNYNNNTSGDTTDDTQSQRVELALLRKQSSYLDLRLDGFYEQFTAEINPDFDRQQGMGGGEWRPFSSTTLSAMAGMTWFEYENNENFNTRVYDCSLRFEPVQRWALDASYLKNFDYATQDGLYRTWEGAGGVSYTGRLSWRVGLLIRIAEHVQINRDDREHGVVGEATYQLTPKVVIGINGDGRQLEFEPVTENVDRYSLGASVAFTPREYIETGCRYVYRNNDSDLDFNDYRENRVSCDLRLTYNMIP